MCVRVVSVLRVLTRESEGEEVGRKWKYMHPMRSGVALLRCVVALRRCVVALRVGFIATFVQK